MIAKIRWIAAFYPNDKPEEVMQLGPLFKTKVAAIAFTNKVKSERDCTGFTMCVFKAAIQETEQ